MSKYVQAKPEERKIEVGKLLHVASSKISASIDIWTLSNYLSFLGVVAQFFGKQSISPALSLFKQLGSLETA
jgi:hypothetical protein